jgi:hypothetical protein
MHDFSSPACLLSPALCWYPLVTGMPATSSTMCGMPSGDSAERQFVLVLLGGVASTTVG